jgi:hypothetical protein
MNGPVSWTSKRQITIALSTMEALSDAAWELLAYLTFFQTLGFQLLPPILYMDNETAEPIAKRGMDHQRSKHIDIRYHFLRNHSECGTFDIQHIPSDKQLVDILTKPLP